MIDGPEKNPVGPLPEYQNHGILSCIKCKKEIKRCDCVLRLPECNEESTSICPECAHQGVAENVAQGKEDYMEQGIPIETVAPVKAKPVGIIPFMINTDKGPCVALQLKYAQPTCPHCKKKIVFDPTEIVLPFAQVQSFYKDLKEFSKKLKE